MTATIIIHTEDDAWAALQRSLALTDDASPQWVSFRGWPFLDITLRPGDGRGTPEILRALKLIENAVYRGFALYRHGTPDTRHLTLQDRHQLAPEWTIQPGSTRLIISLARAANHFLNMSPNRMSGNQQLIATVGVTLAFCATTSLAAWMFCAADVNKEKAKVQGQTEIAIAAVAMTREHTEQMRMLKQAYERDVSFVIRYAETDLVPWRPALLDMAPYSGAISINTITLETPVAKHLAKTTKKTAAAARKQLAKAKTPPMIEGGWIATVSTVPTLPAPMRLGA